MPDIAHTIDVRGMNCPLPVLRTGKALNSLSSGEYLEVMATDPGSVRDMASFCEQTGHRLVASNESEGAFTFTIEKA